ncbi:MAG: thiamine-phosphate kinase [Tannerellaceae bacterium]|jgi:thiamine-monophosphate kinase|nr:thiamine-phosphate kinase [Tannerellaceae bacterium]
MASRTEISTVGEFGLIRLLTDNISTGNSTTIRGIGDDAAVLEYTNSQILVTTDLLLEGIHFDLSYSPLKHIGYKAAIVNFSDIYAMNGHPKQITVSIGISKRFCIEDLEEFYMGLKLACNVYGVDIIGGDTSTSLTGFSISITCIGEADRNKIVYRHGAKESDIICVSGDLGAAYMGLQLLEREKNIFEVGPKDFVADFSGKEYLLERQLKPEARKDVIDLLEQAGIIPTAMIDISDGLSSELLHIAQASGVGCRIYEDRIPIDYQTAAMAETFNMNLVTAALNGGEDYELLFTVPLSFYDAIAAINAIHVIGYVTEAEQGCFLVGRDGGEIPLVAQGWNTLET